MELSPEQIVEALRALRAQIPSVVPLTSAQRRAVSEQTRFSNDMIQSSINLIGASDTLSQAVGMPAADVRKMVSETSRWTAVEAELRTALNGVAGANLVRRQRIALVTSQAYNLARHLVRVPGHEGLIPLVEEVRHLRKLARRGRRGPESPTPATVAEGETRSEWPVSCVLRAQDAGHRTQDVLLLNERARRERADAS